MTNKINFFKPSLPNSIKGATDTFKCLYLSHLLKNSPHIKQAGRLELSSEIARTSPWILSCKIHQLNLDSENRGEVAKIAAAVDFDMVRYSIRNFGLENHSTHLYDLAALGIRNDPFAIEIPFSEHLHETQLIQLSELGSSLRLNKVKQDIQKSENPLKINPKDYHLSLDDRFEMAKTVIAKLSSEELNLFSLKHYELNPEQRIQIAKQIVDKNPFIDDLKIEVLLFGSRGRLDADPQTVHTKLQTILARAEQNRFHAAKKEILAAASPAQIDPSIYRLNSEHRFEIAKIAITKTTSMKLFPLDAYILSENERFQLGKIYAEKSPFFPEIEKFVNKTTIEYESLYKIAEKIRYQKAKQDLLKGSVMDFSISKYELTNREELLELALLAIKRDPEYVKKIMDHKLSEKDRIIVARKAAELNGEILSKYIHLFEISSDEQLFTIAVIALTQNNAGTAKYIHTYQIRDQKFLDLLRSLTGKNNADSENSPKNEDLWKISNQDLKKRREKLLNHLDKLHNLKNNSGAMGGEKTNSAKIILQIERELKEIEAEMKKRKIL